ncbi:hypothetical protein [Bacillus sp. FSL R9-9410]|uniref:hypothetical protein n=1 Tax=Bacillus sp. FSL R9-9410 TaxID=2921590 RepID=UPI00310149CD
MYDENIKKHERRNRYNLYMKNKPVNKSVSWKKIISEVNIHAKRGIYRLLGQNGACKNNHYEDDYEFNVDFLSSVEMIAVW